MRASIIFAAYLIADAVQLTSDRPFVEAYSRGEKVIFFTMLGVGLLFDGLELWLKWRKRNHE